MKENPKARFDLFVSFLESWGMRKFFLHLNATCFDRMIKEAKSRLNKKEVNFLHIVFDKSSLNNERTLDQHEVFFQEKFLELYNEGEVANE